MLENAGSPDALVRVTLDRLARLALAFQMAGILNMLATLFCLTICLKLAAFAALVPPLEMAAEYLLAGGALLDEGTGYVGVFGLSAVLALVALVFWWLGRSTRAAAARYRVRLASPDTDLATLGSEASTFYRRRLRLFIATVGLGSLGVVLGGGSVLLLLVLFANGSPH